MHVNFEFGGQTFSPSGAAEVDLSIPIAEHGGASAWYVDHMRVEIVRSNGFLGSVAEGGAREFSKCHLQSARKWNPHRVFGPHLPGSSLSQ